MAYWDAGCDSTRADGGWMECCFHGSKKKRPPQSMLKFVDMAWYQHLPYVEIVLVPARYTAKFKKKFRSLTGLSSSKR
jgi:hypothetical protein